MSSHRRGRAQRYRDRAEECFRLADLVEVSEIAKQYRRIAEHYLELAETEEKIERRGWQSMTVLETAEPRRRVGPHAGLS